MDTTLVLAVDLHILDNRRDDLVQILSLVGADADLLAVLLLHHHPHNLRRMIVNVVVMVDARVVCALHKKHFEQRILVVFHCWSSVLRMQQFVAVPPAAALVALEWLLLWLFGLRVATENRMMGYIRHLG